jgi:hypothetical protein
MYPTLLMSTGLTFGSISALFGVTNHIIDQQQYTVLVTAVIGSAVVPTVLVQGGNTKNAPPSRTVPPSCPKYGIPDCGHSPTSNPEAP